MTVCVATGDGGTAATDGLLGGGPTGGDADPVTVTVVPPPGLLDSNDTDVPGGTEDPSRGEVGAGGDVSDGAIGPAGVGIAGWA